MHAERASTNRWKKFVGNLHSMHLLATVRDRSCTRKRSGRLEGVRGDNAGGRKRAATSEEESERGTFSRGKWTRDDASEEDSNRQKERKSRQEERVCLRRGENPRGERNLASFLFLSLPPPFFFSYSKRENQREEEKTEEASE